MTEETQEVVEKTEYEKVWCKCEFTQDELRDIAETLAIKTQELDAKEGEKNLSCPHLKT